MQDLSPVLTYLFPSTNESSTEIHQHNVPKTYQQMLQTPEGSSETGIVGVEKIVTATSNPQGFF